MEDGFGADADTPVAVAPPPPASGAAPRTESWVAVAQTRWMDRVGLMTHGRIGKALKPLVDHYGEAVVLKALDAFLDHRERKVLHGDAFIPGLKQFVEDFRQHLPMTPAQRRAAGIA